MAYQKQTDGNHIARGTIESRAELKRQIESERLLDLGIQRAQMRQRARIVNTTVRLTDLAVKMVPKGVSLRDHKLARQARIKQQARREGRQS